MLTLQRARLPSWLAMWTVLILFAIFAAGCSSTATAWRCPPLAIYSKQFQAVAAEELQALPEDGRVPIMVMDYGKLRKACRAMSNASLTPR